MDLFPDTRQLRPVTPLARRTMAYVLAGGRGSRLHELTDKRAKPAVHFGGKWRIIDFALSNALNSGIRNIGVATQYKAHSLIRHLQLGWTFLRRERNESFDILPASQRVSEEKWYLGTADAVYQNIEIIESIDPEYILILAGDHIYKMDYEVLLQEHVATGADVTVACIEVPQSQGSAFGIMQVDRSGRILDFLEKPASPPSIPDHPDVCLASMGIYVFNTRLLIEILQRDALCLGSGHDFGQDIIPQMVREGRAYAHHFGRSCVRSADERASYWRDVGTIEAYWEANIDLSDFLPALDIYDRAWPIWTYTEGTPPAKFIHDEEGRRGHAISSLVCGGCIVSGATIRRTLLFSGVKVNSFSMVTAAVVLPDVDIGRHARLTNVVIDRGVQIPPGLVVGEDPQDDRRRFRYTASGISLITQPMINRLRHP